MLDDLGNPPARVIARSFAVSEATARRWIKNDNPPLPVLLATYWLTRWGQSEVDAEAVNAARMHAGLYEALRRENNTLKQRIGYLERTGDFGTANMPTLRQWSA